MADTSDIEALFNQARAYGEKGRWEDAAETYRRAAELARQACGEFDTPGRTRFVAGAMGPTTKALSVTGGVTFQATPPNFVEISADDLAEEHLGLIV